MESKENTDTVEKNAKNGFTKKTENLASFSS